MPEPRATSLTDPFYAERKVEFSETDMAGIVHFSNFFRYMEFAEARFFEALGLDLFLEAEGYLCGWPRVHAECRFRSPLRFGDHLRIGLGLTEIGTRSLSYRFRFFRDASPHPVKAAVGGFTTVFTRKPASGGEMENLPIPDRWREPLARYLLPQVS